jgi:Xaa-Pro aminopeptidase
VPVTVTDVLPDDEALRRARRERVLAEMEADDVDILIIGREANARYIAGAPRLWIAGSRPFGPGCVLVRATGAIHLISTWDEGIPDDIPHDHLHGITFNAMNVLQMLHDIEGASSAPRVATDGLTPGSAQLLPKAFPVAEIVDGEQLMRRARRIKTPEEIDAIRTSVRLAEAALESAESALRAGQTERQLTAVFMEAMASAGVTTPTTQDVAWITSREHPWRRSSRDTPVAAGDLVAFDAGVINSGYVGEVGRTRAVGEEAAATKRLFARWDELWDRLLEMCRPGTPLTAFFDAYDAAGVPLPPTPVVRGLGLGYDLPLATPALPRSAAEDRLEAGMVLALTAYAWQEGLGAAYGQDPVLVTASGPELLSTISSRNC